MEVKKSNTVAQDVRLFRKILNQLDVIPYPGEMKQMIRTAVAFSDESEKYDYLRRLYLALHDNPTQLDIHELSDSGFTTREIEGLTHIPKSSVSRKLKVMR